MELILHGLKSSPIIGNLRTRTFFCMTSNTWTVTATPSLAHTVEKLVSILSLYWTALPIINVEIYLSVISVYDSARTVTSDAERNETSTHSRAFFHRHIGISNNAISRKLLLLSIYLISKFRSRPCLEITLFDDFFSWSIQKIKA